MIIRQHTSNNQFPGTSIVRNMEIIGSRAGDRALAVRLGRDGNRVAIEQCTFETSGADGGGVVAVEVRSGDLGALEFANNLFVGQADYDIRVVDAQRFSEVRIINDTFAPRATTGLTSIQLGYTSSPPDPRATVVNNLFAGSSGGLDTAIDFGSDNSYLANHNLFFDFGTAYRAGGNAQMLGDNDIQGVDPELGAGTFVPSPTSPAVDAADPGFAPMLDRNGLTRPRGPAPDIGCFEL